MVPWTLKSDQKFAPFKKCNRNGINLHKCKGQGQPFHAEHIQTFLLFLMQQITPDVDSRTDVAGMPSGASAAGKLRAL